VPPGWGASELCRREQMQFKVKLPRPNRSRPRPNRVMKWAQPDQKKAPPHATMVGHASVSIWWPFPASSRRWWNVSASEVNAVRGNREVEGAGWGGEPRRCLGGRRRAVWGGPMREGLLPYPVARPAASLPLSCISAMPTQASYQQNRLCPLAAPYLQPRCHGCSSGADAQLPPPIAALKTDAAPPKNLATALGSSRL
jgi:hypothetical protein